MPPPIVRVPRTSRSSYQPDRPLEKNVLLQSQIRHFREIEKDFPPEEQTGITLDSIRTEGQAAEYIGRVTRKIHQLRERQ